MAAKLNAKNSELVRADDDANNNEIGEFIIYLEKFALTMIQWRSQGQEVKLKPLFLTFCPKISNMVAPKQIQKSKDKI